MTVPARGAALRLLLLTLAALAGGAAAAAAQQPAGIAAAKTLYEAASYEEALAALAPVDTAEALQYRALCQLALGRASDAERTTEALVTKVPTFVPKESDVPPRFVALVASTRTKVLPKVIRQTFAEGRQHFQAKSYGPAVEHFRLVIALASEPAMQNVEGMTDLSLLAQGFVDLAAAPASAPPAAAPTAAPASRAAAADAPSTRAAAVPLTTTITPAAVVSQAMPAWPRNAGPPIESSGAVRVQIGADGRVKGATIETPMHPRYDLEVLAAAWNWRYKPAMRNGDPIASEKLVTFEVKRP